MDIDMDVDDVVLAEPPTPDWVPPPSASDNVHQGEDGTWILTSWNEENSTPDNLQLFLNRWPPSRTPGSYCTWIAVDRGGIQRQPVDYQGLSTSFQALIDRDQVSVEELDRISKAHNALVGKWLIFAEPDKIDALWGKLVRLLCLRQRKGSAKVAPRRGEERHVICVYTEDYTNIEEVKALRAALRSIGVRWRIGFKPDAYTHLGIYSGNSWKIRPSRYFE